MTVWGATDPDSCQSELLDAFRRCGQALFHGGLNNSHSGNLSVRDGGRYFVTRTRSMCHEVGAADIVCVGEAPDPEQVARLSREYIVHKAIYSATSHAAVVHCHPQTAIALSLVVDEIRPLQIEGHGALPGVIPVLEAANASASPELCKHLAPMLQEHPAVMVRGHGLFVGAGSLDQATHRAFIVEDAARIIVNVRLLGGDLEALYAKPYLAHGYRSPAGS
jgi:L-fuculose-phosphate aldolase